MGDDNSETRMAHLTNTQDVFKTFHNTPDSLYDQSLNYIVDNIHVMAELDPTSRWRKLRDDVALPTELCETILHTYQKSQRVNDNIANIFRDRNFARLKIIRLRNSRVTDEGLRFFLQHKPKQLELVQCEYLSQVSLETINNHSQNLLSLKFGPVTYVLSQDEDLYRARGYVINAPNLKSLTIQRRGLAIFPTLLLKPLPNLVHLDLSECTSAGSMGVLSEMKHLQSLVLHSVHWSKDVVGWIVCLTTLKHLDLSQANERHGKFYNPNKVLTKIVTSLPLLESLDISGTNLAGTGASVVAMAENNPAGGDNNEKRVLCDIPGLVSRVSNPLHFLGLYGTHHGACKRHDIPAERITGDASEQQIILASQAYMDRPAMLTRVLNDLYYLFRYETNGLVGHALATVLEAMEKHPTEKHIQISGSATLFYIVKGREKERINIKLKKKIISALLDAMEAHLGDDTMMRNGCLTLCQFKIPQDVLFEYDRVVRILLTGVSDVNQEGFVQRIAIYLLNSLACQVDGAQKQFLGDNGAISKMLNLIAARLERGICDDVLEVAWSTMWNVTDETPDNCRRFLENRGMEFFLGCLKIFPNKDELLRNMMGLLGNVAEVPELRPQLMNSMFLCVFYDLLDSSSDGIETFGEDRIIIRLMECRRCGGPHIICGPRTPEQELRAVTRHKNFLNWVSYNAAGVLAHMASDGPVAWSVIEPPRHLVLQRVADAVNRWDLKAERNINYRSFEPILNLLHAHHTPACQHWAVWALANLTSVYPEKYCGLVESEGGLHLLHQLLDNPDTYHSVRRLAELVIDNCAGHAFCVAASAAAAAAEAAEAEAAAAAAAAANADNAAEAEPRN